MPQDIQRSPQIHFLVQDGNESFFVFIRQFTHIPPLHTTSIISIHHGQERGPGKRSTPLSTFIPDAIELIQLNEVASPFQDSFIPWINTTRHHPR
ncbi:hypothetical protein L861_19155 [Litchfieldella anticariensis FP35 = DSM 16096]|uniref:Uncharacterized protein n=1 Tax=Litchfieldella anticariensis (strain DSM 16096 / CECT 5854 / CIP 108499 / LMG 22089 / FP35) TaxID=1121939 RepID=S2KT05_LITA3|nr:hypothetical protein L861_19155 [Halomonas anticariensis FP35 = DSM 16096]